MAALYPATNALARVTTTRFGHLNIAFDERVLTPRPWTEMQSRWAAELSPHLPDGDILELCAGAGHIGLLAAALTGRRVVQVEADQAAAAYALDNATSNGLADRVEVRPRKMEVALGPGERFPLVLADPPYLKTCDVARWPDDPRLAIDGGSDGLAVMRSCLTAMASHLMPGGAALLQVAGPAQADQVAWLVSGGCGAGLGLGERRVHDDERAVVMLTC